MRTLLAAILVALATLAPAYGAPAYRAPPFPKLSLPKWPPPTEAELHPLPVERINDFSSDITIAKDGAITVRETISIRSDAKNIVHGIFRKFPTRYLDRDGHPIHVRFDVRGVQRDGKTEPYRLNALWGDTYLQIGDAKAMLPRGSHTYVIVYETDRQIGFFPAFDEFYWNVTGTEWSFPILHAEATVHLPEGGHLVAHSEYTGSRGARGGHASAESRASGARFYTTALLKEGEGLTIALDFNKGIVAPLSLSQKVSYLIRDNKTGTAAVLGLLVLAAYFFAAWMRFGRDPQRGVIVPLFSPPEGFSAAAVRFIRRMDYDAKCFAAALVSMAVKGYLRITNEKGTYVLTRTGSSDAVLAEPERATAGFLFRSGDDFALDRSNQKPISNAIWVLHSALKEEDEGRYFNQNRDWYYGGVAILIGSVAGAAWLAETSPTQGFVVLWVFFWLGALIGMLRLAGTPWLNILGLIGARAIIFMGVFFYAIFAYLMKPSELLAELRIELPWIALTALLAQACLAVAFYHLLKAPTAAGAKIREEIEGFRVFLDTAERDRLEKLHPPQVTPEVFEKYLPYAIALDTENSWSKRFEAEAARAGLDTTSAYVPSWYTGQSFARFGSSGFVSSLGSSIASATVTASSAPVTSGSYGGGGGGFSGGGGGGGGGGGW